MEKLRQAREWFKEKWQLGISFARLNKGKTATILVATSLFITGTALASQYYNVNSTTIHHVYLDGEEVGTVDHPDRVSDYVQQEIDKNIPRRLRSHLSNQIEFKESTTLKKQPNTAETMRILEKEIDLKAPVKSLTVDHKVVGYVSDELDVSALLNEMKGKYSTGSPDEKVIDFKEDIEIKKTETSTKKVIDSQDLEMLIQEGTLEQEIHIVKEGDTLGSIAEQYGVSREDIRSNDPGIAEDTVLVIDQEVNVTVAKPLITVQTIEQPQTDIVLEFALEATPNDEMFRGDSRVVQAGHEGLKKVTHNIVKENGVEIENTILKEEIVSQPMNKIIEKGTKVKADRGSGHFVWPANGGYISSGYGARGGYTHKGIDIARPSERTIKAADNGRVVSSGWNGGYGNCVVIDHGNGYRTLYAHMESLNVSAGTVVQQGEKLGVMGNTGNSTGIHVHFEVMQNGAHRNPLDFLRL